MRGNTDSAQIFIRTYLRHLFFFGVKLALITGSGRKIRERGRRRRRRRRGGASSSSSFLVLLFRRFFGIGIDGRGRICSGVWELTGVAHGLVLEGWIILPVKVVAFVCGSELCILFLEKNFFFRGMIVYFGILFAYLPAKGNDEGKNIEMMERLTRSLHKQQKMFSGK